jgi:endonuclease/exonuclease/phosphatase (EEP) superfamily protein YafD
MRFSGFLLWPITVILVAFSLTTAGWYRLWLFELIGTGYLWFASFTFLLLITLLGVKPLRGWRRLQIGLAIALLLYTAPLLNLYLPRLRDTQAGGTPLTLMTYNVNYQLWNTAAVEQIVRTYATDLLGLVEPTKQQAADLENRVQDLYPHYYRAAGGNLSLLSRYPVLAARTDSLGAAHQSLFATLDFHGQRVQVIVSRPPAPITKSAFNRRNQVLQALGNYANQQPSPLVVMGDFNTTSWSFYLHQFTQRSGLRNAAWGHGIHPTWYYATPTAPLFSRDWWFQWIKIPIDHIFISPTVRVEQIMAGPAGISDHRPLIVKLRLYGSEAKGAVWAAPAGTNASTEKSH